MARMLMIDDQLQATQKWLTATLKTISDAAIAVDATGNVVYMNQLAEELTGWDYSTAENATIEQVVNLVDASTREPINVLSRALEEPHEPQDQAMLVTRTGETIAINDQCTPIKSDSGKLLGGILIFQRDRNA
ncbi:MAG: PAS domain-containing protein [Chloroflexota bacterium]|nr:PAS domain-containing protein [Chloroflexota bacterium]